MIVRQGGRVRGSTPAFKAARLPRSPRMGTGFLRAVATLIAAMGFAARAPADTTRLAPDVPQIPRQSPTTSAPVTLAASGGHATTQKRGKAGPGCPALYPRGTIDFGGLNPAIEGRPSASQFRAGDVVEIDPLNMDRDAARELIADLQSRGARVSIYLVGGHCVFGRLDDCDTLQAKGVRLGPTGSWNWDSEEKRILDIAHPAVLERIRAGARLGWDLGANYIRVDNLHYPAGSEGERTPRQMKILIEMLLALEDELRADRTIPPERVTGLVAHNNLEAWEHLLKTRQIRRPPGLMTSERTAQLAYKGQRYKGDGLMKAGRLRPTEVREIIAGSRMAVSLGIPYTVAEFDVSHDLGGSRGSTYRLPQAYVEELGRLPGITEVLVIPDESHYVGRGTSRRGTGPSVLAGAPFPAGSDRHAAACLRR